MTHKRGSVLKVATKPLLFLMHQANIVRPQWSQFYIGIFSSFASLGNQKQIPSLYHMHTLPTIAAGFF